MEKTDINQRITQTNVKIENVLHYMTYILSATKTINVEQKANRAGVGPKLRVA